MIFKPEMGPGDILYHFDNSHTGVVREVYPGQVVIEWAYRPGNLIRYADGYIDGLIYIGEWTLNQESL